MSEAYLLEHKEIIIGGFFVLLAFSGRQRKHTVLSPLMFLLLVLGLYLFFGGITDILSVAFDAIGR